MKSKKPSFHISVDDVLPSLLEVSDSGSALTKNPFFGVMRDASELYGVKIGLNLFYTHHENGFERSLQEVRSLSSELEGDWLFFGPHALNSKTPPYSQSVEEQIFTFEKINDEIDRIAPGYKSKSIRLHHYSECYENAEYFLANNIREIFTTDKPVGLHRFGPVERENINENGFINFNGMRFSKTHFRVEDLANKDVTRKEFLTMADKYLKRHQRVVIYSHEYEHHRDEVNRMFLNVLKWLTEDLLLECEHP